MQGVTFTAVAPMIAIGNANGGGVDGLLAVYGTVIVAGIVTFLFAPYFSRLLRLFPPVVTGTVITIIGLALVPVAVLQAGGGDPTAQDFASLQNIAFAGGTFVVILLLYRFFRGFIATFAVLLGLIIGTVVAAAYGIVDFSGVGEASWVGVTTPFYFGWPTFGAAAIVSMVVVMLITAVETTGDVFATGEIVDKPIRRDDIARAIRADGLATTLDGILNSFPYTCFAENVGLVRLTGVRSRFVVAAAGVIMIVIGLLPKIGAVVAAVPSAVLGGAALILFATVAVIGIQTFARVDFHDERNVIIIAASLAVALIPVAFPTFYQDFPGWMQIIVGSGITTGSIAAILLNILFNILGRKGQDVGDYGENVGEVEENLTVMEANDLDREAFADRFAPLFQGARWVPEAAYEKRPFVNLNDLRHAFQATLFDAPRERQVDLIRSYPPLGEGTESGDLTRLSARDRAAVGLDRLSPEEREAYRRANEAYEAKFGFPLVTAIREHTKGTILEDAESRMRHTGDQEVVITFVEIVKIARLRLEDLMERKLVGAPH